MKFVFSFLFFLNVLLSSSTGQNYISPFTSIAATAQTKAKITNIEAFISGNKTFIKWNVAENQSAYLFELEKSVDGKTFITTALIFGTDKQETGKYEFYEKPADNQAVSYRIKLVSKDKTAEYSEIFQAKK